MYPVVDNFSMMMC